MRIQTRKDLGLLIRDRRKKQKMTQAKLAELVGVDRRWVIQVESDKTSADLRIVLRVLRTLGVEMQIKPRYASPAVEEIGRIVDSTSGRRE